MKAETAQKHVLELETVMRNLYSAAIVNKPTMLELTTLLKEKIYETKKYKALPEWAKGNLAVALYYIRKRVVDRYIINMYVGLDGRKILPHKAWDKFTDQEKTLCQLGGLPMKHFWMEETETFNDDGSIIQKLTPTDKVYWYKGMV
jgi:hypothetical protein